MAAINSESVPPTTAPLAKLRGALAIAVLMFAVLSAVQVPAATSADAAAPPNIVLITADDMAKTDLRWMPRTKEQLRDAGVELQSFVSNHPLCCPARAEILTGQYGHNNGVIGNRREGGGYTALAEPGNHVGAWLQEAGYNTALVGKHMNKWDLVAHHQPGWTRFDPILERIDYPFDLTFFNDGNPRLLSHGYNADLVGHRTVSTINRFAASPEPFFIWSSHVVPHAMHFGGKNEPYHPDTPKPAPRHKDLFPSARIVSVEDPAYNEADVSDKPAYVRQAPVPTNSHVRSAHLARIRSLRALDDQVANLVTTLEDRGELADTLIFFTSDNGYLLGQHRLTGKNVPYEQTLRVPLLVRGPGITPSTQYPDMYSLVDLAPTFVDAAGATPGRVLDGRSMLSALRTGAPGYSHYLIQAGSQDLSGSGWWWRGVRSDDYVYWRYDDGFEELYDLNADPAQLTNVANNPDYAAVRSEYAARLERLRDCVGEACQTGGAP
ncbi:MAG: sulfatase family protein [Nocardioidaceae bacterium]